MPRRLMPRRLMPKYLRKFLEELSDEQADELWLYFDGCDSLDLVEVLVNSHPEVIPASFQPLRPIQLTADAETVLPIDMT